MKSLKRNDSESKSVNAPTKTLQRDKVLTRKDEAQNRAMCKVITVDKKDSMIKKDKSESLRDLANRRRKGRPPKSIQTSKVANDKQKQGQ